MFSPAGFGLGQNFAPIQTGFLTISPYHGRPRLRYIGNLSHFSDFYFVLHEHYLEGLVTTPSKPLFFAFVHFYYYYSQWVGQRRRAIAWCPGQRN
jgi:hypothetical protein